MSGATSPDDVLEDAEELHRWLRELDETPTGVRVTGMHPLMSLPMTEEIDMHRDDRKRDKAETLRRKAIRELKRAGS